MIVKVPDEGVTVTPGLGATCQCTVGPSLPAGARPSVIDAGWPTVNVVDPLGSEKPTAGSWPLPKEGGAAPAEEPQEESAVPESV
jgi:hypothetical protein